MTATLSAPLAGEPFTETPCAHCGLPVSALFSDERAQFCCTACATAFVMLQTHGLGAYHHFAERRTAPVAPSRRGFADFDHAAFHARYVQIAADGTAQIELALEGVHCASCVWLIERVPLLVPGTISAVLDVRQSRATVRWDAGATTLSTIASMLDALGYTPHPYRGGEQAALRRREDRAMLVRIGVAGAIATNVMLVAFALYSGELNSMDPATISLFRWISCGLTIPALVWPGRVFFVSALAALRARRVHMDVPIALALGAGAVRGTINTVTGVGPIYFDGVCALVFLLLVGRFLQARGQRAALDATEQLFALTPMTARLVNADGGEQHVPTDAVPVGALIVVHAGESVPTDGTVVAGRSAVNRAILTGESKEVTVGIDDRVYAGTLNCTAALRIRVTASGDDSRLARILAQVSDSARHRAPVVLLADRLAARVVVGVLVLAVVTYLLWVQRAPQSAWDNTIALLIVTCPCALALATPLAMSAAVGRAARAGIFVKGGEALESFSRPGWLVLDKTGTLTRGETTLVAWRGDEWTKRLILALEVTSSHPIAAGFQRAWGDMVPAPVASATHTIGGGVAGTVEPHHVVVGSPRFVRSLLPNAVIPAWPEADGYTAVIIAVDGAVAAQAAFGDAIREDAAESLAALRRRGWRTVLLSGDTVQSSMRVGIALGFAPDDIIADASPEQKAEHVRALVSASRATATPPCVAMVGDGVNDTAAIAAATVGIGVHGGAEASLSTADVAFTRPGLGALVALDAGAQGVMRVIRRNIAWAFTYNAIGIVLAMTGHISPLIAAIMMPASSLTVVLASWLGTSFRTEAR